VAERTAVKPEPSVLYADLCDHWVMLADRRCGNYWHHEVVLTEDVQVRGHAMFGRYPAGVWHFCNRHYKIFMRDRQDGNSTTST
jgi:hypothetical protein